MAIYYKYILSFIFFVANLHATNALQFQTVHAKFQHPTANDHRMPGDPPVSVTIEDGSHEEFIGQSSMQSVQPDKIGNDHIQFMSTAIPDRPVFPFRRPPKLS